jgi:hypothetical protein
LVPYRGQLAWHLQMIGPTTRTAPRRSAATGPTRTAAGTAEPFPSLTAGVVTKWCAKRSPLTLSVLRLTQQFLAPRAQEGQDPHDPAVLRAAGRDAAAEHLRLSIS